MHETENVPERRAWPGATRPEAVGSTRWFGRRRLLMPVLCKRQNPEQDHVRQKCSAGMNSFGQDEQDRQDAEEETGSGPSCESCTSCPKSPDGMSCTKRRMSPNDERDQPPATSAGPEPRGPRQLDRHDGSGSVASSFQSSVNAKTLSRITYVRSVRPG
jgi:hypothetical protein